ncbi:MAG: hypothetical protein CM1200mP18_20500 [Gammaproteobacteria bacterium]|nr:MAG: hypothetical protein CM1200mP18_20500 [Gammaproteobacteria bacterium]
MRVLIAMMKHETNTFSPVLTDLTRFKTGPITQVPTYSTNLAIPIRPPVPTSIMRVNEAARW